MITYTALLFILLILLRVFFRDETIGELFNIGAVVVGAIFFSMILFLIRNYIEVQNGVIAFNSTKKIIEMAPQVSNNRTDKELAALQQRAIIWNVWLAKQKHWNKTIFDEFVPNVVDKLEPIPIPVGKNEFDYDTNNSP